MKFTATLTAAMRRARETALEIIFARRGLARVVNGLSLRVDPRTRRSFTREYDPEVADYLRSHVEPGAEVWNVGANVGVYVLQLMRWLGGTGRIVAFEPNPNAARLLRSNLRLSGGGANVEIVECAVGELTQTVPFYLSGADGMSRAGHPNPALAATESHMVSVTTLDEFAAKRGRSPRWVVMDIEGWEIGALRGGRGILHQAGVIVELHPGAWEWSGHSRGDMENFLEEERLELVPLGGQIDPLAEHGPVLLHRRGN